MLGNRHDQRRGRRALRLQLPQTRVGQQAGRGHTAWHSLQHHRLQGGADHRAVELAAQRVQRVCEAGVAPNGVLRDDRRGLVGGEEAEVVVQLHEIEGVDPRIGLASHHQIDPSLQQGQVALLVGGEDDGVGGGQSVGALQPVDAVERTVEVLLHHPDPPAAGGPGEVGERAELLPCGHGGGGGDRPTVVEAESVAPADPPIGPGLGRGQVGGVGVLPVVDAQQHQCGAGVLRVHVELARLDGGLTREGAAEGDPALHRHAGVLGHQRHRLSEQAVLAEVLAPEHHLVGGRASPEAQQHQHHEPHPASEATGLPHGACDVWRWPLERGGQSFGRSSSYSSSVSAPSSKAWTRSNTPSSPARWSTLSVSSSRSSRR